MGKRMAIITLTENDLKKIVKQCINEIGGRTLASVDNSAINSVNNIQNHVDRTFYGTKRGLKMVDHNDNIIKADALKPKAIQSFLNPYKNYRFLFWAYKREGNPIHLIFQVENIKKALDSEVILSGNVVFGREQLPGDIIINFVPVENGQYNTKVSYKYKGNRYKYLLQPNVNTEPKWNELIKGLQDFLRAKLERGL